MANDRRRHARPGKPPVAAPRPGKPHSQNHAPRPGKPYHGPRPNKPYHKPPPHAPAQAVPVGTGEPGPPGHGVLELHPKGFGFLRNPKTMYVAHPTDPYVPGQLIDRFGLREGVLISGPTEATRGGTGPRLTGVEQIEGRGPKEFPHRNFDELTAV